MATNKDFRILNRNNWLFISMTALFAILLAYKLAVSSITIDLSDFSFSDLLNLILVLFAIGMSLAFYFKATETSNQFYDNTYSFTKDISEILGRIEAGFGERLRHLDEGYAGIRERVERLPVDTTKTEEAIRKEEEAVKKQEQERRELIEQLATRAKLEEKEKEQLFQQLKQKDRDLASAKEELAFFRTKLQSIERPSREDLEGIPSVMSGYIGGSIISALGGLSNVSQLPLRIIQGRFNSIQDQFPSNFLEDMKKSSLLTESGNLNLSGAKIIRRIADQMQHPK